MTAAWTALCLAALAGAGCVAPRGTIGAVLAQTQQRRLLVRDVPSGLAAERAGLLPGDEVLLIDGRDVRGMSPDQLHAALSGEVGELVKLTVVRGQEVVRLTLRRTPARSLAAASAAPVARHGDKSE